MAKILDEDLIALQNGIPPISDEALERLTVRNEWLQLMKDYCLEQVIANGGSKVKILYGSAGTGKSHYLHDIRIKAVREGFFVVYFNLLEADFNLTNSVELYRAIAKEVDFERLSECLCALLIESLGYGYEEFIAFGGTLTDYLCEMEQSRPPEAQKEIRYKINSIVNDLDIDFSYRVFMHRFMESIVERDRDFIRIAKVWLKGEKVERKIKLQQFLYETISKSNARICLYSLIEIIKLMKYRGVIIIFDQFEAILPKSKAQISYTPQKRNDVYELLRQFIDDLDFFHNMLFLISGDNSIIENEKYGLQSYHALWMRIQPGFNQVEIFNPYADLIDANQLLDEANKEFLIKNIESLLIEKLGGNPLENIKFDDYCMNYREIIQYFMSSIRMDSTDGSK